MKKLFEARGGEKFSFVEIYMNNNNLTKLNKELHPEGSIDLSNNPLDCSDDPCWLYDLSTNIRTENDLTFFQLSYAKSREKIQPKLEFDINFVKSKVHHMLKFILKIKLSFVKTFSIVDQEGFTLIS